MFDLETAITDWKSSLAARESLNTDNIAELETHLRESLSSLRKLGLGEEEVFLIDCHRVGSAPELEREYRKENPNLAWVRRLKWMCVGFLFFIGASFIGNPLVGLVIYFQEGLFPAWSPFLASFVGRSICQSIYLGITLILVTRYSWWFDYIYTRFRQRQNLFVFGTIFSLAVIPPIAAFTFEAVRIGIGGEVSSGEVFASMFSDHLLMTMPIPFVVGGMAILLHRREQNAELA